MPACIVSWPSTDNINAGWKMEARGRVGERRSRGRANEKAMEATESSMPEAMSCGSEAREPSRESAESE